MLQLNNKVGDLTNLFATRSLLILEVAAMGKETNTKGALTTQIVAQGADTIKENGRRAATV